MIIFRRDLEISIVVFASLSSVCLQLESITELNSFMNLIYLTFILRCAISKKEHNINHSTRFHLAINNKICVILLKKVGPVGLRGQPKKPASLLPEDTTPQTRNKLLSQLLTLVPSWKL